MKKNIVLGCALLVAVFGIALYYGVFYRSAVRLPADNGGELTCAPAFEEFKAGERYVGPVASVNFKSRPEAEQFRTAITDGAKSGPNFAGHYTVVSWGCGTSCQSSAIVDAVSGDITEYGVLSMYELGFRADSNLLVINPEKNVPRDPVLRDGLATDYYELKDGKLSPLCKKIADEPEPRICIQVLAPARNPFTGEVRVFPTPCDVPAGWEGTVVQ